VVYKVDRLTRSLLDFARLVEAFDRAGTSFVSITQSFNTTTSMGRLTLNMLPSFAQLEREVTAERKVRETMVRQRTQILNSLRGHLAEIGIIAAQGPSNAYALAKLLREGDASIPRAVAAALLPLVNQLDRLDAEIKLANTAITELAKVDPIASPVMSIPGIGPVTASALVASVGDPSGFSGPRQFAAFLGLATRQNSSGGKTRLGRVSKMGNGCLRKLLVVAGHSILYHRVRHNDPLRSWANKLARMPPARGFMEMFASVKAN